MKESSNIRRYAGTFLAVVVATLTLAIVGRAAQTLSVPNASVISFTLAPGANSAPITPVTNQAVFLIGTQTGAGYRGVAMATILHVPSSFIEWVGLESTSGAAITEGFNSTPGTHILYLDLSHLVDVQVASADTIWIHNANTITMTGNVKLIW